MGSMFAEVELRQNIVDALSSGVSRLKASDVLRQKAIARCERILDTGTDRDATRIIAAIIAMERLQLDRETTAVSQNSSSIRLSAPANLADVHALLDALRQPAIATDASLQELASPEQPNPLPVQATEPPTGGTK
jgi:hypothetical protein